MVVMKNAFTKNIIREIIKSKSRFLSIFAIIAIGVAFFAGVRATSPDMQITADKYLDENNLADISVLSKTGFTEEDIEKVREVKGVSNVVPGYRFDALALNGESERAVKIHSIALNKGNISINSPVLLEGSLPTKEDECVTEKKYLNVEKLKIGDYVELKTQNGVKKFKITGMINSPMYINSYQRGNNSLGNGETQAFFQIGEEAAYDLSIPKIPLPPNVTAPKVFSELSVMVEGAREKNSFLKEYDKIVEPVKERIEDLGKERTSTGWYVFGRDANIGFSGFGDDADRIAAIGQAFPIIFFLVATLVCLTTMTRMVEEHRTEIGTLKALGYGKRYIILQYFLYSFTASILGSIAGLLIGFRLFPTVIFTAYKIMYDVPALDTPFNKELAIIATLVAVLCTTLAAILACAKELIAVPATLMRPKAPKAGKRIFIERIKFIWNRMSFTSKVTARNLLRYKKRFFMSIIGIAGCTALLLTGFGLKNSIVQITEKQFGDIYAYNMRGYLNLFLNEEVVKEFVDKLNDHDEVQKSLMAFEQRIKTDKESSKKNDVDAYIMVPQDKGLFKDFIKLRDDKEAISLSDNGVVITEKLSKLLNAKKGDIIKVTLGDKTVDAKVDAIAEQYIAHYVYMSKAYYKELFDEAIKYNQFTGIIKDTSDETENSLSKSLMKDERINSVNFTTHISSDFKKNLDNIDSAVGVMIISAAALAFVVMYNLTNININERIRELATIKVLGFYDGEVAQYVYRENVILSIIGALFGLILGIVIHRYVIVTAEIDMVMFVRKINMMSYMYSALLTLVFSGLVNLVMYRRLKKIDMIESLKSAE